MIPDIQHNFLHAVPGVAESIAWLCPHPSKEAEEDNKKWVISRKKKIHPLWKVSRGSLTLKSRLEDIHKDRWKNAGRRLIILNSCHRQNSESRWCKAAECRERWGRMGGIESATVYYWKTDLYIIFIHLPRSHKKWSHWFCGRNISPGLDTTGGMMTCYLWKKHSSPMQLQALQRQAGLFLRDRHEGEDMQENCLKPFSRSH